MAAEGFHRRWLAVQVDRALGAADRTGRLDGDAHRDVLPGGDAAEHAAGVVAGEALRRELVAVLRAALRDAGEAGADLHALDRVDAHHRVGDVGIEPVIHRLAPAHRHVRCHHVDARAARITRLAQFIHVGIVPELEAYMDELRKSGDSCGARIDVMAANVPVGWGEPVYDRLDADIA
ncbi:MAG: chorismate synthase, partial [Burkholderiaceae bacterium]